MYLVAEAMRLFCNISFTVLALFACTVFCYDYLTSPTSLKTSVQSSTSICAYEDANFFNNTEAEACSGAYGTTEQTKALHTAYSYYEKDFNSKKTIYLRLQKEGKYSKQDALFAIEHLKVDYKLAALGRAMYLKATTNMSDYDIYFNLCSSTRDRFTEKEAKCALGYLDKGMEILKKHL